MDQRLGALKRVPILAELSKTQLEQVVGTCKWQQYNSGEQILSYHTPSTEVFYLAAGKVRVIIYSTEGKAVVFTDLKPGAMFGKSPQLIEGLAPQASKRSNPAQSHP